MAKNFSDLTHRSPCAEQRSSQTMAKQVGSFQEWVQIRAN
jgi:hypothetical protein